MKKPKPHSFPIRVYYEDTDAGGIVYHSNYVNFAERGRTELLRSLGWDHQTIKAEHGLILVVRNMEIDFRAPARLDDLIDVETRLLELGNTSMVLQQDVLLKGKVLAELKVVIVAITLDGKPLRLPPQLRQIFEAFSPLAED